MLPICIGCKFFLDLLHDSILVALDAASPFALKHSSLDAMAVESRPQFTSKTFMILQISELAAILLFSILLSAIIKDWPPQSKRIYACMTMAFVLSIVRVSLALKAMKLAA